MISWHNCGNFQRGKDSPQVSDLGEKVEKPLGGNNMDKGGQG